MLFLMSLNISKKVLPAYELTAISLTIVYLSCFTVSPGVWQTQICTPPLPYFATLLKWENRKLQTHYFPQKQQ